MMAHLTMLVAKTFFQRLLGIRLLGDHKILLIPNCRVIHTIGLHRPLNVAFIDRNACVVRILSGLPAWRIAGCRAAWAVMESFEPLPLKVGQRCRAVIRLQKNQPKGYSLVEVALALPVFLFVILVVIQIGLLWHARFAVTHAALVAARQASLHHGSHSAIRDGLVYGLLPLSGKTSSLGELPGGVMRAGSDVTMGLAFGWIRWEVLSPTRQSFQDWGGPPDPGLHGAGTARDVEIPALALPGIAQRRQPKSGVSKMLGGLPVGNVSGQTLIDANNLKIHLQVGIPLQLPIAGRLLARTLGLLHGCGWTVRPPEDRIGLVGFGSGVSPSLMSHSIECRSLSARDIRGNWVPRWPIGASAVIQMQSNARQSLMVLRDRRDFPSDQK
jgi:hypothetical protein